MVYKECWVQGAQGVWRLVWGLGNKDVEERVSVGLLGSFSLASRPLSMLFPLPRIPFPLGLHILPCLPALSHISQRFHSMELQR